MSVVDLSNLREATDGDKELEAELFDEFISSSGDLVEQLRAHSIEQGDVEVWRKSAHALKGIATNLGANSLWQLCCDAQDNFEKDVTYKEDLFQQIEAVHSEVIAFLKAEMS